MNKNLKKLCLLMGILAMGAVAYANKAAKIVNQITGLKITANTTPIKNIPTKALAAAIAEKEDGNCYRALKNEGFIK